MPSSSGQMLRVFTPDRTARSGNYMRRATTSSSGFLKTRASIDRRHAAPFAHALAPCVALIFELTLERPSVTLLADRVSPTHLFVLYCD